MTPEVSHLTLREIGQVFCEDRRQSLAADREKYHCSWAFVALEALEALDEQLAAEEAQHRASRGGTLTCYEQWHLSVEKVLSRRLAFLLLDSPQLV